MRIFCFFLGFFATLSPSVPFAQKPLLTATVSLTIKYQPGVKLHFSRLPYKPGMTILDAMESAKLLHPRFSFTYRGSGKTAFLTSIDGFQSVGSGKARTYWFFWVNNCFGDRSFAAVVLSPGAQILWSLQPPPPMPSNPPCSTPPPKPSSKPS